MGFLLQYKQVRETAKFAKTLQQEVILQNKLTSFAQDAILETS
jgi:hypothetical protein